MNIEHLKTFLYVLEQGSISKAAELCSLSQSAVSQQIRSLEQQFGTALLERNRQGVSPTAIGAAIHPQIQNILTTYGEIFDKIQQSKDERRILRILSTPIAYSYALPCTFYHVNQNYPEFRLVVEAVSSSLSEEKVLSGYADMGIILGPPQCALLKGKRVFSDRVYLVAGSKLHVPPRISQEELYQYPLLMLMETQRTRQHLDEHLKKAGIAADRLNVLYALESIESIKISAVNSYGLAFLPYMSIKKELYNKQLRIIDCVSLSLENNYFSIQRRDWSAQDPSLSKPIRYIEKILADTIC